MTLDDVREEMKKMGANKAQCGSHTLEMVYEILSGADIPIYEARREYERLTAELQKLRFSVDDTKYQYNVENRKLSRIREEVGEAERGVTKYIKDFNKSLENCETKEARDKMRIAQIFVNSVDVRSPQNNTAFIYGLSQILVGESFDIQAFKKVEAND